MIGQTFSEIGGLLLDWIAKNPDASREEIDAFIAGMQTMQKWCHEKALQTLAETNL